jgi:Protein of unknown function (DUF2877)
LGGLARAVYLDESEVIELKAISLGYAVPRHDFNVMVHSVFPESVNLQSRNCDRLLTLVTADCSDLPQGIRLATPPGFSFDMLLRPSEKLVCQNDFLEDELNHLSINLCQAKRWKCDVPNLEEDEITQSVVNAWTSVWQMLNERQRLTGAVMCAEEIFRTDNPKRGAITEKFGVLIRELVKSARKFDSSIEKIFSGLIGLGPGLTPSGDDFLVGFLTGLRCMKGKNAGRLEFLSELDKLVIHLSCHTNAISHTYLFHAANGQVSSKVEALVGVIVKGETAGRLRPAADVAMRVGHSSGMETVTGLLIGLATWGNKFAEL